jgi:hypothetical protein
MCMKATIWTAQRHILAMWSVTCKGQHQPSLGFY